MFVSPSTPRRLASRTRAVKSCDAAVAASPLVDTPLSASPPASPTTSHHAPAARPPPHTRWSGHRQLWRRGFPSERERERREVRRAVRVRRLPAVADKATGGSVRGRTNTFEFFLNICFLFFLFERQTAVGGKKPNSGRHNCVMSSIGGVCLTCLHLMCRIQSNLDGFICKKNKKKKSINHGRASAARGLWQTDNLTVWPQKKKKVLVSLKVTLCSFST